MSLRKVDKEEWTAYPRRKGTEAFIESSDFTHDVRLYVNGDFSTDDEAYQYAKAIAVQLNKGQAG